METILGLLLVLLPLVFKLVEKMLKSSGKTDTAAKVHEWAEIFGNDEDDMDKDAADEDDDLPAALPVKQEADVSPVGKPMPADRPVEAMRVVPPKPKAQPKPLMPRTRKPSSKPLLVEEEKKKDKERIDPKKLVIYSEIMKPKY